ncbi:hypothetical protein D3C71_1316970 [compost metagenome]
MGQGEARRARHKTQHLLRRQRIHLVDHAVDVVGQAGAHRTHLCVERHQAFGARGTVVVLQVDGQAQGVQPSQHGAMRIFRQLRRLADARCCLVEQAALLAGQALHLAPSIGEKAQRALGGDTRVQLAQAAGRGIARIDEDFFVTLGLGHVQFFEVGAIHQHFAAHFQHLRGRAL